MTLDDITKISTTRGHLANESGPSHLFGPGAERFGRGSSENVAILHQAAEKDAPAASTSLRLFSPSAVDRHPESAPWRDFSGSAFTAPNLTRRSPDPIGESSRSRPFLRETSSGGDHDEYVFLHEQIPVLYTFSVRKIVSLPKYQVNAPRFQFVPPCSRKQQYCSCASRQEISRPTGSRASPVRQPRDPSQHGCPKLPAVPRSEVAGNGGLGRTTCTPPSSTSSRPPRSRFGSRFPRRALWVRGSAGGIRRAASSSPALLRVLSASFAFFFGKMRDSSRLL